MRNKGRQKTTQMTANGRIDFRRIRWQPEDGGSLTPIDDWLEETHARFTRGVVELACRLNRSQTGFEELAQTLERAAGLRIGKESLRQLIEAEGQAVLEKIKQRDLKPSWQASDCRTDSGETRVYMGCDGVKVPVITETEKKARRAKVVEKRKVLREIGRAHV